MFCPFCGGAAEVRGRVLICIETGTDFSEHVTEGLLAAFRDGAEQAIPRPGNWGASWFCPADGEPMNVHGGIVVCRACERSLNPFLYELIEFNWHPTTS